MVRVIVVWAQIAPDWDGAHGAGRFRRQPIPPPTRRRTGRPTTRSSRSRERGRDRGRLHAERRRPALGRGCRASRRAALTTRTGRGGRRRRRSASSPGRWANATAAPTCPAGQTAPLPRVNFWAVWNEPNFGEDLGPQAVDGSTVAVAPAMYRSLVAQAWNALQATGHGADTILIGEFAPWGLSMRGTPKRPQGLPGSFGQTKPLRFLRTLYCVDSATGPLRGTAARAVGCPTTAAGSRRLPAAQTRRCSPPAAWPTIPTRTTRRPRSRPHARSRHRAVSAGCREPGARDRPRPAGVRLAPAAADLQHRVRLHHPPAEPRAPFVSPGDRGVLPQLGGVPELEAAAHRVDDAVPRSTTRRAARPTPATAASPAACCSPTGLQKPSYAAYRLPLLPAGHPTRRGRAPRGVGLRPPGRVTRCSTPASPQSGRRSSSRPLGRRLRARSRPVMIGAATTATSTCARRFPSSGTVGSPTPTRLRRSGWTGPRCTAAPSSGHGRASAGR